MNTESSLSLQAEWKVDTAKCNACADCRAICPVGVFVPLPPPCQAACPISQDAATYVALVKEGKFREALDSIMQVHPFPGILGRVCTHPCEESCTRARVDHPIAIRALKRCADEYGQDSGSSRPVKAGANLERVAIVGSGPAGLMAAYDLARLGYRITVFEALPMAGGMLYAGVPEYRLPREVIRREIRRIENLGAEIRLNTFVGREIELESLQKQGYASILLATGAHQSLKLQIPGEDGVDGVVDAVSFLREVNLGRRSRTAKKAVVVGGGNAAIDSARSLLRLGAEKVSIVYRRTRTEMPAIESEVTEAEREGVSIHYLIAPARVVGDNGAVVGLECVRTQLGETGADGRRTAVPVAGSEFFVAADLVVSAIGQKPELSFLPVKGGPRVSKQGLIVVDRATMATGKSGVFAAGDNVTGPATVVEALAAGKRAALSIHRYLRGEPMKQAGDAKTGVRAGGAEQVWWRPMPGAQRQESPVLPVSERRLDFKEVELTLTRESAVAEATRCLECHVFGAMDLDSCCRETCRICERHCSRGAIISW